MNERYMPPEREPQWVDTAISNLLRSGVILSISVIILGLTLSFVRHPEYVRSTAELGHLTDAHTIYAHRLGDVFEQIAEGRGQAIVMLGLLLLIATPVARVAFSIAAFALGRDRLYVVITSVVLVLLFISFAIGAAE